MSIAIISWSDVMSIYLDPFPSSPNDSCPHVVFHFKGCSKKANIDLSDYITDSSSVICWMLVLLYYFFFVVLDKICFVVLNKISYPSHIRSPWLSSTHPTLLKILGIWIISQHCTFTFTVGSVLALQFKCVAIWVKTYNL